MEKKDLIRRVVLEYDLEIDERVEIVYAGFQRLRDLVTVKF